MIGAQTELKKLIKEGTGDNRDDHSSVSSVLSCSNHLADGLKIARDCGFGLYHIDLLLTRARLHLLEGRPDEALADFRVALDDDIPADAAGQPELLAARAPECGYAWAIAEGVQLIAEALLLQAAQTIGCATLAPGEPTALGASSGGGHRR